jgi:hypothetical protein
VGCKGAVCGRKRRADRHTRRERDSERGFGKAENTPNNKNEMMKRRHCAPWSCFVLVFLLVGLCINYAHFFLLQLVHTSFLKYIPPPPPPFRPSRSTAAPGAAGAAGAGVRRRCRRARSRWGTPGGPARTTPACAPRGPRGCSRGTTRTPRGRAAGCVVGWLVDRSVGCEYTERERDVEGMQKGNQRTRPACQVPNHCCRSPSLLLRSYDALPCLTHQMAHCETSARQRAHHGDGCGPWGVSTVAMGRRHCAQEA